MTNDRSLYKFFYHWWKNIDKSIFFLITLLFAIGLFFSLVSTSLIASDKLDTNSYFFFFKHLFYICIGIFIIFIFSLISTEQLFKYSIIFFFYFINFIISCSNNWCWSQRVKKMDRLILFAKISTNWNIKTIFNYNICYHSL